MIGIVMAVHDSWWCLFMKDSWTFMETNTEYYLLLTNLTNRKARGITTTSARKGLGKHSGYQWSQIQIAMDELGNELSIALGLIDWKVPFYFESMTFLSWASEYQELLNLILCGSD